MIKLATEEDDPGYGIMSITVADVFMNLTRQDQPFVKEEMLTSSNGLPAGSYWAMVRVFDSEGEVSPIWFTETDGNVYSSITSFAVPSDSTDNTPAEGRLFTFDYHQSSKPIHLDRASLHKLLNSNVKCDVFFGDTGSKDHDEMIGSDTFCLKGILQQNAGTTQGSSVFRHSFQYLKPKLKVDFKLRCSASLLDALAGVRQLTINAIEVDNIPSEWYPLSDHDIDISKSSDQDKFRTEYVLELYFPDYSTQTGAEPSQDPTLAKKTLRGALSKRETRTSLHSMHNDSNGSYGIHFEGSIEYTLFPETATRLVEYLSVYKYAAANIHRFNYEKCTNLADVEVCEFNLDFAALVIPGVSEVTVANIVRSVHPNPQEYYAEGIAASENKKELQESYGDYDALLSKAKAIHASMAVAKTTLSVSCCIIPSPLIQKYNIEWDKACITEETILSDLNLSAEATCSYADLEANLENDLTRILEMLMCATTSTSGSITTRSDTLEQIVDKLQKEGRYQEMLELVKIRVAPILTQALHQYNPSLCECDDIYPDQTPEVLTGSVHLLCVSKIKSAMQNMFREAGINYPGVDASVQDDIKLLGVKALDYEANQLISQCESIHLDRIAYVQSNAFRSKHLCTSVEETSIHRAMVWYDYATFCLRQQAFEKAHANLRHSISICSNFCPALLCITALLIELHELDEAYSSCKRAIAESSDARDLTALSIAHGLLAYYHKINHSDTSGNLLLYEIECARDILSTQCDDLVSTASVWLKVAHFAYEMKLHHLMNECLQLMDDNMDYRCTLSDADRDLNNLLRSEKYIIQGDREKSVAVLEVAVQSNPSNAYIWYAYGNTHVLYGDVQEAIRCYQLALPYLKQLDQLRRATVYINLGNLLLRSAQFEAAKTLWTMACCDFDSVSFWLGLGKSLFRLGDLRASEACLSKATKIDHRNAEAWAYLTLHCLDKSMDVDGIGKPECDITVAKRFVEISLHCSLANADLLRELGSAFIAVDQLEDAERLLRRSLYLRDSYITRKALGDILLAQNFAEEALEQYSHVIKNTDANDIHSSLLNDCIGLLKTLGRSEDARDFENMRNRLISS